MPDTKEKNNKQSVQEFSAAIKEKYPAYKEWDDTELANAIIEKYPVYKDQVSFDPPKKKDQPVSVDSSSDSEDGSTDPSLIDRVKDWWNSDPDKKEGKEELNSAQKFRNWMMGVDGKYNDEQANEAYLRREGISTQKSREQEERRVNHLAQSILKSHKNDDDKTNIDNTIDAFNTYRKALGYEGVIEHAESRDERDDWYAKRNAKAIKELEGTQSKESLKALQPDIDRMEAEAKRNKGSESLASQAFRWKQETIQKRENVLMQDKEVAATVEELTVTSKKLPQLYSESQKLHSNLGEVPDLTDADAVDKYNSKVEAIQEKIKQYNEIKDTIESKIATPQMKEYIAVNEEKEKLYKTSQELLKKYPEMYDEIAKKAEKQASVDKLYREGNAGTYARMAVLNSVARAGTAFVKSWVNLIPSLDFNNEYGVMDAWKELSNIMFDYVDNAAFDQPSEFNKPLIEDTKEGKEVNWNLLVPKITRTAADMATLIFGASKISTPLKALGASEKLAQNVGLFVSSYAQINEAYYKEGINQGLDPSSASWFAIRSAMTSSALEMISPQRFLMGSKITKNVTKGFIDSLGKGMSRKTSLGTGLAFGMKETGLEMTQETFQFFGDRTNQKATNEILGYDAFDPMENFGNELLETNILTLAVAGGASLKGSRQIGSEMYYNAVSAIAENPAYMDQLVQKFKENKIDQATIDRISRDIALVKTAKSYEEIVEKLTEGDTETESTPKASEKTDSTPDKKQAAANKELDLAIKEDKESKDHLALTKAKLADLKKSKKSIKATEDYKKSDAVAKAAMLEEIDAEITEAENLNYVAETVAKADSKKLVEAQKKYDTPSNNDQIENSTSNEGKNDSKGNITPESKPDQKKVERVPVSELTDAERIEEVNTINEEITKLTETITEKTTPEERAEIKAKVDEMIQRVSEINGTKTKAQIAAKVEKTGKMLTNVLKVIAPKVTVEFAESKEDFIAKHAKATGKKGQAGNGFYDAKNNKIVLNLNSTMDNTAFHEFTHPILDVIKENKPEIYKEMVFAVKAITKDSDLAAWVKKNYKGKALQENELVTEFMADFANAKFDHLKNKPIYQKLKALFKDLWQKIFGVNINLDKLSIVEALEKTADALAKGTTIKIKDAKVSKSKKVSDQAVDIRKGKENLEGFGLIGKYPTKREIAKAFEKRQAKKFRKIKIGDYSDKAKGELSGFMVEEILFEVNSKGSALGWYTTKYQEALDILSKRFPTLKNKADRQVFTMLIALTSDGQKVQQNFRYASELYEQYLENGKLDPESIIFGGDRNKSIKGNSARVNDLLIQFDGDMAKMTEYLLEEKTVSELKAIAKKDGISYKSNYLATEVVPRAAGIFGEKLGAFYANLSGSTGYLTMDRWWTRTFNRYRGTLLPTLTGTKGKELNSKGKKLGLAKFKELIGTPDITDNAALKQAKVFAKTYMDKGFKNGTTQEKAANTIYKKAFVELNDAPQNASDRSFMIEAIKEAQAKLSKQGHEITIADMQALLWYFEKRLYGEVGYKAVDDVSYADAANRVANATEEIPEDVYTNATVTPDGQIVDGNEIIDLEKIAAALDKVADAQEIVVATAENFAASMKTALDDFTNGENLNSLSVDQISKDEAQIILEDGGKLFLTSDNSAGGYVKADGYMGGLFKSPKSKQKGVAKALQSARVKEKGFFMEALGTPLVKMYVANGFRPIARLKFNEEYAPEQWDHKNSPLKTKPDNVFLAYDPQGKYKETDGKYFEDYDKAYEYAKEYGAQLEVKLQSSGIKSPLASGKQNTEFFTGKAKEASSKVDYVPVINIDQETPVAKAYDLYSAGGNFTGHISKMIAGFAEKQVRVAEAIVKSGAKNFLDIGTSEGGMIKTVSASSNIKSVGIDPNPQMMENFNTTPEVKNAEYRLEAFEASWTDDGGQEIKKFTPKQKFDVVNEDYAFQFMNNDRAAQIAAVKGMMTEDGILVTSEKFHTANQEANEKMKYKHQEQYFNAEELTEDKQTIVTGMADDMVNDVEYYQTLQDNFKHVIEFWNAGNFKGFLASNNLEKINKFQEDIGDLSSEFSDDKSLTRLQKGEKENFFKTSSTTSKMLQAGVEIGARSVAKEKGITIKEAKVKFPKEVSAAASSVADKFSPIRKDAFKNPESHKYKVLSYEDAKAELTKVDETELLDLIDELVTVKSEDNVSVLATTEYLNRLGAEAAKFREAKDEKSAKATEAKMTKVYHKLIDSGRTLGQLLGQFKELKNGTAVGIVGMVESILNKKGHSLTEEQHSILTGLAVDYYSTLKKTTDAKDAFLESGTEEDLKLYDKAQKITSKADGKVAEYIETVVPKGIGNTYGLIVQGNLLTQMSIATNVIANIIYSPQNAFYNTVGNLFESLHSKITTGKSHLGVDNLWLKYGRGLGGGIVQGVKGAFSLRPDIDEVAKFDVKYNIRGFQTLMDFFSKKRRDNWVKKDGKTPFPVYMEKLFTGISGVNADIMFRLLYMGDKPFRNHAEVSETLRIARWKGIKLKKYVDFRKFQLEMNEKDRTRVKEAGNRATFSDERLLARAVKKGLTGVNDFAKGSIMEIPTRVLTSTVVPFVRVPSNLVQEVLELAVPPLALVEAYGQGQRGDVQGVGRSLAKAMLGVSFFMAGKALYGAGLIMGNGSDDDKNERALKREISQPNGYNSTAIARGMLSTYRAMRGLPIDEGNPWETRPTDEWKSLMKLGVVGMYMGYAANLHENAKKDKVDLMKMENMVESGTLILRNVGGAALDLSMLGGALGVINAMVGQDNRAFYEMAKTSSVVVIPNNWTSSYARVNRDHVLSVKSNDGLKQLYNMIDLRTEANPEGLQPKVTLFGGLIDQTPESENAYFYHNLNVFKPRILDNPIGLEISKLSRKYNEWGMLTYPPSSFTLPNMVEEEGLDFKQPLPLKLSDEDVTMIQVYAGSLKYKYMKEFVESSDFKNVSDDIKIAKLKDINSSTNSDIMEYMASHIYYGIQNGSVKYDEKKGTYEYISKNTLAPPPVIEGDSNVTDNKYLELNK